MTDTQTLAVPGATLSFSVRGDLSAATAERPPLLVFGSPMDSTFFGGLAGHLEDRVVVLLDPRNTGASRPDDAAAPVSPQRHADDLHALVEHLAAGAVDVFGTSGGAVNALHLVAAHPGDVRTVVAHEPPLAALLPDADAIRAACDDMLAAYDAHGPGPAMARFIALVVHRGEVGADHLDGPAPDPADFGLPTADDGSRDDPLMANMRGGGVFSVPDLEALRRSPTRVVVAVGEQSGGPADGELAGRASYALAEALGQEPVVFPGGHGGFLDADHGPGGDPEAFAVRLREVLG